MRKKEYAAKQAAQRASQPPPIQPADDNAPLDTRSDPARTRDQAVAIGKRGIELRTLDDVVRYADFAHASRFCPMHKDEDKNPVPMSKADIVCCLQTGMELGITPSQSLNGIAVINGRSTLYGDLMLSICRSSSVFDQARFKEWIDGIDGEKKENLVAHCECARVGCPTVHEQFSFADCKKAGLQDRQTYQKYLHRMLKMRARAFALRDTFTDCLSGMMMREEMLGVEQVIARLNIPDAAPETEEEIRAALSAPADDKHIASECCDGVVRDGKCQMCGRACDEDGVPVPMAGDGVLAVPVVDEDDCKSLRGELMLTMKAVHDDLRAAEVIAAHGMEAREIAECTDATHLQSCIDALRKELEKGNRAD